MVICRPACRLCVKFYHIVAWSCEWWMLASQTGSFLASREMNFWLLLLD